MKLENEVTPSSARAVSYLIATAGVMGLIVILALEVSLASRKLSATWDEPYNLLAGLRYWQAADFGINSEHPPLAKLVAALPLLSLHLNVPSIGNRISKVNGYVQGRALLHDNDADTLLLRSRLAVACFGLMLVLLLLEAGYQMFGAGVGWLAAVLALFEPNLLAHSALVTADFGLACVFFAGVYAFWRVAERPTAIRLIGCGVALGLALAVKLSGLYLIPTLILLAAIEVASRFKRGGNEAPQILLRETLKWTGRLAVIGACALVVLWGVYRFHYRARPAGLDLSPSLYTTLYGLRGHFARALVNRAARYRFLPESYLYGLSGSLAFNAGPRVAFLFGHLYPNAFWYYFPCAMLIKSTLGFLILLILALIHPRSWSGETYRKARYVLIPPALFLGFNLTSGTNIGIRHILPVYPFLILAAAAGSWKLAKRRTWAVVVAGLVGFHIISSLLAFPNYLAYSNEVFGGPSRTYRVLSDSNADWGQGLIQARDYLAQHNLRDCWFAYNGSADPGYYHIPCKMLPDPFLWWWGEPMALPPESFQGVVLISGTEMSSADWGPEELNPYNQFLTMTPAADLGGSIMVFEGDVDLHGAAAQAHMNKGWELHKQGMDDLAAPELLKAEELAPAHPGPPSMLGTVYAGTGQTDQARSQLTLALRLAEAAHPEFQSIWLPMIKAQLAALD